MGDGGQAAAMGRIGRLARQAHGWWRDSRRGGVATMMGAATPVLVGFMALAIDTTYWETSKLRMQAATDQAAQAAGRAYKAGAGITGEAAAVLAAHGYVNGLDNVAVTVNQPPPAGAYAANPHAIEVTLTQPQRNILSSILGVAAPVLSTSSVTAPPTSPGGGACIIALGTAGEMVTINGSNTIDGRFCNFYNNSVDAGATRLVGGGTIRALNAYLVGDWTGSGFFLTGRSMQRGVSPVADPYAERSFPAVPERCDANATTLTNSATFNVKADGLFVFCKGLKLVATGNTLTLGPGIYMFDRDALTINGDWTINATNATLYFTSKTGTENAELKVNGTQTFNLVAPTSGPTRGIAVWMDPRAEPYKVLSFGGSSIMNVTGAIYAPSTEVTVSGSNGTSGCTQVVARSIVFNGNNTLKHDCGGVGVSDPPGSVPALVLVQ